MYQYSAATSASAHCTSWAAAICQYHSPICTMFPLKIDRRKKYDNNPALNRSLSQRSSADLSPDRAQFPRPPPSPAQSPGSRPRNRPVESNLRRQSLVAGQNTRIIRTLLDTPSGQQPFSPITPSTSDYFNPGPRTTNNIASMLHRKVWVRRPGASPTLVQIREDELVDDLREMILKKYANSLGRNFDAPDMTLRIATRADSQKNQTERLLGPEEEMCRTLDAYYPGGQTVDEAIIIDIPGKRTPRPSPRSYHHSQQAAYDALQDYRPVETGTEYFPPMPALIPPSNPQTATSHDTRASHHPPPPGSDHGRSISVLNTGQLPLLPSPGGTRRHREHRPKYQRQHTSSPTIITHASNAGAVAVNPANLPAPQQHLAHRPSGRPRLESTASDHANGVPAPPPLPTPPAPEAPPTATEGSTPPTPAVTKPHRPSSTRPRRGRKPTPTKGNSPGGNPALPSSLLDGSVPPINVLIVEDNIINLKLLEAFMKRLKVRWSTAMNGQIAVNKWKTGGFHLVLMDIQLPIMSGLEATKEIRRLERVNGIGVFSNSSPGSPIGAKEKFASLHPPEEGEENEADKEARKKEDDKLKTDEGLFKSPVIIVALTASSLQSDRHEALAAGCNDFLTKVCFTLFAVQNPTPLNLTDVYHSSP